MWRQERAGGGVVATGLTAVSTTRPVFPPVVRPFALVDVLVLERNIMPNVLRGL